MKVVCLDLEGVLVPEVWINFAEAAGIPELKRTTRDEPCYDTLMRYRLDILAKNDCRLPDIQRIVATLKPLPGAREFLDWLKSQVNVIILSDTFAQFAGPLMAQLDYPTIFCHELEVDGDGRITDYLLRMPDQKRAAIEALRNLKFTTIAGGDSYNDLSMIQAADHGIFFRPPESLVEEQPQFPVANDHSEFKAELEKLLAL